MGNLFARYLGGATTYSTSDSDQKSTWFNVQVTRIKRLEGWHKWTFDFDADKGLSIRLRREKESDLRLGQDEDQGFCRRGPLRRLGQREMQTIWVDDVRVTLGGPMQAKLAPPPPPAPIMPAKDPAAEGRPVAYQDKVASKHPRLLITGDRLGQLKAFYNSPEGKFYRELLEGYVDGCTVPANRKTSTGWGQQYA